MKRHVAKRGRPAIGTQVGVKLPPEFIRQIDELAANSEFPRTRSDVIRELVVRGLRLREADLGVRAAV